MTISAGATLGLNEELTMAGSSAFIEMGDIVTPSDPFSGFTRIFHDSVDGVLKVKKFGGSVVSLEAGGGGQNQTPWLTNINAAQFDLENVRNIEGRDTGADGSFRIIFDANEDFDTYIADDAVNDTVRFVAGNAISFFLENRTENSETFGLSLLKGLDMLLQPIQFSEASDPATPAANKVRLFLRSSDGALSVRKDDGSVVSLEQGGAGGGANTNLGNLVATVINQSLIPDIDNTRDLGQVSPTRKEWRNLHLDGTANIDFLSVTNGGIVSGGLTVNNTLTSNGIFIANDDVQLGNTTGDRTSFPSRIESNFIPDVIGRDLGDTVRRWDLNVRNLNSDSGFWDLNGTDIFDVGDIEIDGALNHDGTTVGFFNFTPKTRRSVAFPSGPTGNNSLDILFLYGAINALLAALGDSGYGLVNT
jgi:hypothetical protein